MTRSPTAWWRELSSVGKFRVYTRMTVQLTVVGVLVSAAIQGERARVPEPAAAGAKPARQALMPWFLWVFVGLVLVNSLGALPPATQSAAHHFSRACLVVAIAALGMKTSLGQLARAGWRPLALIVMETLWIAAFVLAVVVWRR